MDIIVPSSFSPAWKHADVYIFSSVTPLDTRFADAVPVLEDELAITIREDIQGEERWVTIGMDAMARVLTVVYTWRDNTVRIISARPATPNERKHYMENR